MEREIQSIGAEIPGIQGFRDELYGYWGIVEGNATIDWIVVGSLLGNVGGER